jgi:ChrR-like protein with cupin domain
MTGELKMAINKLHEEFGNIDMAAGWSLPEGYPSDALAEEKILSGALDHKMKRGSRTRLLRFKPGFLTHAPFVHDYWEEVLLLQGDMIVGGESFKGYTYCVRPPGVYHGPFKSEDGALLLEVHYFDPV